MDKILILNKIRDYLKINSDAEFARYLGIKPNVLSNWRNRNTFNIELIYTKCGFLDPEWLLTGEGQMLKAKDTPSQICDHSTYPLIPYYNISASAGPEFFFNDLPEVPEDWIRVPFGCEKCLSIPIHGKSMEPEYHSGDVVLIREIRDILIIEWGKPHIVITDEQRLFKILRRHNNENYMILKSLNPNYDDIDIPKNSIRKLYKIEALISKKTM